ncbi:adenylate kinase 7-like [Anoplophora glabripennis]|uniref:adenylate kinase 7-like n=1 Tax=Anoplophora glabripennis TaxID=217634 RepID=UPI000874B9B9|nr:adenylate kinase 7-like [Anoplophora glabripennis]
MNPNPQEPTTTVQPLKAIIHGPPASGKSTLAQRLCKLYGAHYVTVKTMIEEILEDLRERIAMKRPKVEKIIKEDMGEEEEEEEEVEEEEEEAMGPVEEWEEQYRDITISLEKSVDGQLPDDYVVRLMKTFLVNDTCQRSGYVLDGYPKNIQQAKEIFGQAAEVSRPNAEGDGTGLAVPGEGGGEGAASPVQDQIGDLIGNASNKIMPDFVFSLQATDDMLCERVMRLPHKIIQSKNYDEVNMLRRLALFRLNNTEENTMLKLFDDNGIHPVLLNELDEDTKEPVDFECIWTTVITILGEPIPGFGLSPEEMTELIRLEQEQQKLQQEEFRLERKLREESAMLNYQDKMERWADTLQKLQMEEEKILIAQTEPLRNYLMKYIFPTLTKALIEVAKIKPDDPVDFLAEFLFKENPEGKMFDPSYTRDGEHVLEQYETNIQPSIIRSCTSNL